METARKDYLAPHKAFIYDLGALLFARSALAPFERVKIVLQAKHLGKFSTKREVPKGALEIIQSKLERNISI